MHLMTQGEISMAKAVWMGMTESLDLIKTVRPALLISCAFQAGKQLATLSTSGCRSVFFSLEIARGMPRYVMGKEPNLPGKKVNKVTVSSK